MRKILFILSSLPLTVAALPQGQKTIEFPLTLVRENESKTKPSDQKLKYLVESTIEVMNPELNNNAKNSKLNF